jgi:hypothetical protein
MRRHLQALPAAVGVAVCLLAASACLPSAPATAAGKSELSSAATEEVRLRAACAASGEQILASNLVRFAVYQVQFSHYSMRMGRCYVEMMVQTITREEKSDRVGRFLYDGETKELLAFAEIKDGKKSGRVYDLNHGTTTFENSGFDDASDYIYARMAGDE